MNATMAAAKAIPFPAPPPRAAPKQQSRLEQLVDLEGAIRRLPTAQAVYYHAVNDAAELLGFVQCHAARFDANGRARIVAVSGVSQPEMRAPQLRTFTQLINTLSKAKAGPVDVESGSFGFWAPLLDREGRAFGGLLLQRTSTWEGGDAVIVTRLAETYAHAIAAMVPPKRLRAFALPGFAKLALPVVLLAAAFMPVPLTALAPFEVVAESPVLATAPIAGVIADVLVEPNQPVEAGQALFRFDDTVLRSEAAVATQKVNVARARLQTAQSAAFRDAEMKRSLTVTAKDLELAEEELAYANALLAQVTVVAPAKGIAVFAARNDWIGKPAQVGEKVMEIASPTDIAYRISLGVHDAVALSEGAGIRLFFDADPLHAQSAVLKEASYHAQEMPGGTMAYVLKALPAKGVAPQRIGLRGTAQISGERVSLGFYLFRRPIAALRQYLGI